jgi:serine/threonine protein kinase/tetratricopeptide (TPR) repeat protein
MVGESISHYRILEKLGEGGMGVVYKAQDTKLDRLVAVKFLPQRITPDSVEKERFVLEAKAASALNHPNITTIHQIDEFEGQVFIVMEYCQGKTLKRITGEETLAVDKVLDIGIQISEGLKAAHENGVVHRDIKSDNIMITPEGRVKIMDFGLAKLKGDAMLTRTGTTLGTVAYMSPEQASGEEVDSRSDIFSLGVVLYEMIAGQLPFRGEHQAAILYSIINETPEPLARYKANVPQELLRIVDKTLRKEIGSRYQSVADLMADLKELRQQSMTQAILSAKSIYQTSRRRPFKALVTAGVILLAAAALVTGYLLLKVGRIMEKPGVGMSVKTGWQNSIAVLPFRDFSPAKDQEYFCDGMTDAIISKLSGLEDLKVISMSSAMRYKDPERDIKKVGGELDVNTVLEGSIQKEDNSIRVRAQLINVADDAHLWSQTFDRELESVFAIQDEISQAIVDVMKIRLLGEDRASFVKRYTESVEAYNAYVQGRFLWNKRTEEHLMKAIEYFEKAVQLDPNYALAYAGLADAYAVLPSNIGYPVEEAAPKAKEAARKALQLDDKLAEAHASMGLALKIEGEFEQAEKEYLRALELNAGYAYAHYWYSLLLDDLGRHEESLKELETAFDLDPLSVVILTNLASKRAMSGDWAEAEELIGRALEIEPSRGLTYVVCGSGLRHLGRTEEAIQIYAKAIEMDQCCWDAYNPLAYLYSHTGDFDKAIQIADKYVELAPTEADAHDTRGDIYAYHGKLDQAIENYSKALKTDPDFGMTRWKLTGMYLFKKDYAKAEGLIQKQVSSKDKKARSSATKHMAQMLVFQGKFEQALAVLDQGIAADEADQIEIDETAEKHAAKFFIFLEKEDVNLAAGEVESIREILEKLESQDPAKLRDVYAILWAANGKISEADEALRTWREEIAETDPIQMGRYHRTLGAVELIKGNLTAAVTYLKMGLVENGRPLFEARYLLAQAYVESGLADEAVEVLEKALLSHDERRLEFPIFSVKAHYLLGLAYQELGRNKEAIGQYQEFLEIWKNADPGIPEVEDAKGRLEKLRAQS